MLVAAASLAGCGAPTAPSEQAATPVPPLAASLPIPAPSDGAAETTILLAAGDIGRCDSTHDDATGALVAGLPGVIATLGDVAYEDGTTAELNDCFGGSWGPVKDRIRFAVTGNHDVHTDDGAPMHAYMGSAATRDGRTWFSDDLGAWHVIVLDGNCGLLANHCSTGSDQATWLRDDLAASHSTCTVALLHQPRFSSGDHGNDRGVQALWDALYAGGVDLVLDGHDHDYERFGPQDPAGTADPARGIVEIIAGTGGAELEGFKDPRPNSLVRLDDTYGVLELTLLADSWSSRFIGVDGAVHDEASGTCH